MSSLTLKTIDFHNQSLLTFEKDGVFYTAMKPICENIGLDWEAQRQRIMRDEVLNATTFMTKVVAEDGKNREMMCLPIQYLNGWLFGVDVNRVKAEIKEKIIMYKKECYQVLHDYWNKGTAVNPRLSSDDTLQLRNAVNLATGVLKLDYSTIYKMVHQRFGVDEIKDLSKEQIGLAVEYVHYLMVQNDNTYKLPEQPYFLNIHIAREFDARLKHIFDLASLIDGNKTAQLLQQRAKDLNKFMVQFQHK